MEKNNFSYKILRVLKQILDRTVSFLGLIVLLPFFVLIGVAIRIDSPGSVLYRQQRIGKDGRPFYLYKFRSMRTGNDDSNYMQYLRELIESERDGHSHGLPYRKMGEDARVTRVGKFLRRYYIDELPQLINIARGEMSLVGPRPHVQFEVDNYTPEQARRLSVRPGLTGLWQATGKAECTFNELIQLDLEYIDHWSLWLDIQLIFRTLWTALFKPEVSGDQQAQPEPIETVMAPTKQGEMEASGE